MYIILNVSDFVSNIFVKEQNAIFPCYALHFIVQLNQTAAKVSKSFYQILYHFY